MMKKSNMIANYHGVVQNRKVLFETHNKSNDRFSFLIHSLVYLLGLSIKFMLSRFTRKTKLNSNIVGISWLEHKKNRFNDYDANLEIIHYNFRKFDLNQIKIFSYIKISDLKNIFLISLKSHSQLPKSDSKYSNILYCFVCIIENSLYYNIIKDNSINIIVITGLNDRHSIFVSDIVNENDLQLFVLQHGLLTKFLNLYKICATRFYYTHDFSLDYLKYFFYNIHEIEFYHLPERSKHDWPSYLTEKNIIAYACTPTNIDYNFKIIDILIGEITSDYIIMLYPHPRENLKMYYTRYKNHNNVIITDKRYKNIKMLITRISSLGVDYSDIGVKPVFINIERHNTDYLSTGKFDVFNDLDSFKVWFHNLNFE